MGSFLPLSAMIMAFIYYTVVNCHGVCPEFYSSHNFVSMAFNAKSPPTQGQYIVLKVVSRSENGLNFTIKFSSL